MSRNAAPTLGRRAVRVRHGAALAALGIRYASKPVQGRQAIVLPRGIGAAQQVDVMVMRGRFQSPDTLPITTRIGGSVLTVAVDPRSHAILDIKLGAREPRLRGLRALR
jgi:hypothetical protein